jgi:hypothetical protein
MGADLLLARLVYLSGVKPDFELARIAARHMPLENMLSAYADTHMESYASLNNIDTDDEDNEEEVTQDLRNRLASAIDDVEAAYMGDHREATLLEVGPLEVLVAGGPSWGDSIEVIDNFNLFACSGLHSVAGFLSSDALEEFQLIRKLP